MTYYATRFSDGKVVSEDEAFANGVLKPGYGWNVPVMFADSALPATTSVTSAAFLDHIPSAHLTQLARVADDANSSELFRVQSAATTARALSVEFASGAASGRPGYSDAAKYAAGLSDRASARAAALNGKPSTIRTTKDSTMNINDSILRMPSGFNSKIHYALADMRADSRMQVDSGIRNAVGLLHQLRTMSGGTPGLTADAAFMAADGNATALHAVVDHIEAAIAKAQERTGLA